MIYENLFGGFKDDIYTNNKSFSKMKAKWEKQRREEEEKNKPLEEVGDQSF